MTTPTLLILPTAPQPGQPYAITPLIGDTEPRTAVARQMIGQRRTVGASGFVYLSEMWWFVDTGTGEIFEREVEASQAALTVDEPVRNE